MRRKRRREKTICPDDGEVNESSREKERKTKKNGEKKDEWSEISANEKDVLGENDVLNRFISRRKSTYVRFSLNDPVVVVVVVLLLRHRMGQQQLD